MERYQFPAKETEPDVAPVRLSILHLFFWMTASAALLGANRLQMPTEDKSALFRTLALVYISLASISGGISLASLAILCQFGFRRPCPFPKHPGHWLLIANGLVVVVRLAMILGTDRPSTSDSLASLQYLSFYFATQALVGFVALSVAFISLPQDSWRWLIGLLIGMEAVVILLAISASVQQEFGTLNFFFDLLKWEPILLFVLALGLVWFKDSTTRRDQLHNVGICLLGLQALQATLSMVIRTTQSS